MAEQLEKILVVDDEQDVLMLVSFQLQKAGFPVLLAESGPEGLEKIKQEKPALVILDRMMPGMDGIEVCRHIRKDFPDLLVLMVTAMAREEDRISGLEAGADDYLTKPYNPKELLLRVNGLLRRRIAPPAPPKTEPAVMPVSPAIAPVNSVAPAANPVKAPSLNGTHAENRATAPLLSPLPVPSAVPSPNNTPQTTGVTAPLSAAPPPKPHIITAPLSPNPPGNTAPANTARTAAQDAKAKNIESLLHLASDAVRLQDTRRARELYLQVLKIESHNETALMWLAWSTNDPCEGSLYLERLVEVHPTNAQLSSLLEAGRQRCRELNQLIKGSSVLEYWNDAEESLKERMRHGIDRRGEAIPKIGQLLITKGFITHEQLEIAIAWRAMFQNTQKLGEYLRENGYITQQQLDAVLKEQSQDFNSQMY